MTGAAPPAAPGLTPRERAVYRLVTIAVGLLAAAGAIWAGSAYIDSRIERLQREQRPIYTLECRPKGDG